MFENFPTAEKVKPTQEVMRADFEREEKGILKNGTDFLENLEPEKFKKSAANWLLAFSLFAGASTAFAGEQNNDKDLPEMGEEQISQVRGKSETKNQTADFDWKKIAGKIEIYMGSKEEDIKDARVEVVGARDFGNSEFYKGTTQQEVNNTFQTIYTTLNSSQNSSEFFSNLASSTQGFSEQQKVMMLQQFGNTLEQTYNYDMVPFDKHVTVSSDKMFQSLKDQTLYGNADKSGICGNIHTFLTLGAQNMGIESGLQSLGTDIGNHVISSLVLGSGDEKEIAFLDYGYLVRTKTLKYPRALARLEMYSGTVSVFNSYVGNTTDVLLPVKSLAGEVVEKAIGVEGSSNRLNLNLEEGERKKEGGLEIKITPETKEVKLGSDSMGFVFSRFDDVTGNPYQSLKDMSALRGDLSFGGEKAGVDVGVTVLNMNIKDLYGGSVSKNELGVTLLADYIDSNQLSKREAGDLLLNFGAAIEGALLVPLGSTEKPKGSYLEGSIEGSAGGRIVYLNPQDTGKFYIDASVEHRVQIDNFQDQEFIIKKVADNIALGGEVKVYEGSIVKIEGGMSDTDWGKSYSIKGGIEREKISGNISYEKRTSDYERFVPSSEKIELGVTYKGGPKWEVDVIGAKTTEKYKDAQSQDIVSGEVKLKMFLW